MEKADLGCSRRSCGIVTTAGCRFSRGDEDARAREGIVRVSWRAACWDVGGAAAELERTVCEVWLRMKRVACRDEPRCESAIRRRDPGLDFGHQHRRLDPGSRAAAVYIGRTCAHFFIFET